MDTPRNFRSAFHGFNREDVVHYLEYINAKHTSQVNQLTAEAQELRQHQAPGEDDGLAQALTDQVQELTAQVRALEDQLAEMQAEKERLEARCRELEAKPQKEAAPSDRQLDIYRRAERTEREARERAELTYFQASGILTEATAKVDAIANEITEKTDAVMGQITQLQVAVSGSKRALQDAAAMMNAIRP